MLASTDQGKRITILFLNLFTWLGGGEYSVYYLVKNIDRSAYRPILLFNKNGPFREKAQAIGAETAIIPYDIVEPKKLLRPRSVLRNIRASFAIKRLIRSEGVDLIQCSDVFALVLLLPALISFRIPVVYSVIVFYGRLRCWFLNLVAILFIRHIVTNSSAVKADLLNKTFGLGKKTGVAYNGVDPSIFYPRSRERRDEIRRKLGLPIDKRIIGFIGRFEVWKGHATFLEAARNLALTHDDLLFLLVGGAITEEVAPQVSRYRREILGRLREMDLNGKLFMFDHRDDIPEIMAALDVYVCPSDYEPFGLVALEAFASGVPVVASSTVGAMEVLGNHEGVFIAEPHNPSSFARRIEEALASVDNGRTTPKVLTGVPSGFPLTWRNYAGTFEALYRAAVQ